MYFSSWYKEPQYLQWFDPVSDHLTKIFKKKINKKNDYVKVHDYLWFHDYLEINFFFDWERLHVIQSDSARASFLAKQTEILIM